MVGPAFTFEFTGSLLSVEGDLGEVLFFELGLNKNERNLLIK